MSAIEIQGLEKSYKTGFFKNKLKQGLKPLTLSVEEGEVFGYLGPNGAGKTTTLKLLLGLVFPSGGTAKILGCDLGDIEVKRQIGFLPEQPYFYDHLTPLELLDYYARLSGVDSSERRRKVDRALARVGMTDSRKTQLRKFSKGMLQRLGFAQAMLHDPDLLILDEPTASLDPVGRKEFRDILQELKRRGKTIFISSHILSELETVCDRVAILEKGELKRVGSLQELSTGKSTRVVLRNVPGAALEALSRTPAEVTMLNGLVTVKCVDLAMRESIDELLRKHGIQPEQSTVETQSLENIFLSSIGTPPKL